jgi:archaeal flagellin FlaB
MKIFKQQSGITGLETGIIFLAFLILAGVFAYSVLSAGLFSTEKSKEAIDSGLKHASGTVVLKGAVFAKAENTGADGYVSQITFTLSTVAGGEPVDFTPPLTTGTDGKAPEGSSNSVVISYKDDYQTVDNLFWTASQYGRSNGDNLLDNGEKILITIGNTAAGINGGNLVDALTPAHLGTDTRFDIEIKTPGGAALTIERITPAWINKTINLDTTVGVNLNRTN